MAAGACYRDGPQAFLIQRDNVAAGATLTPSGTRSAPAEDVVSQQSVTRADASTGQVVIGGDHTAAEDAEVRVRITGTGSTSRASAPSFSGVGNGTMTSVAVPSTLATQELIVTLIARDNNPAFASAQLGGYTLQALTAGNNDISITVTRNLTQSAAVATLVAALSADQFESENPSHDFGAFALDAAGRYDPATPRLQFGIQPEVYRQHIEVREGKDWLIFSPPLVREVAIGTPVYTLSGDYDVTVSDGVTTENYNGLTTIFDLLTALLNSALVEVVEPILPDFKPGGISVTDIPIVSDPVLLGATVEAVEQGEEGTDAEMVLPSDLAVLSGATTGTVTIACTNPTPVGAETWSVTSSSAGSLGLATTGVLFDAAQVEFTVPERALPGGVLGVDRRDVYISAAAFEADNGENTTWPQPELRSFAIGSQAAPKKITFTYRNRPSDACGPSDVDIAERIRLTCLTGATLVTVGEAAVPDTIPANILTPYQNLITWVETKSSPEFDWDTTDDDYGPVPGVSDYQVRAFIRDIVIDYLLAASDLADASLITDIGTLITGLSTDTFLTAFDGTTIRVDRASFLSSDPGAASGSGTAIRNYLRMQMNTIFSDNGYTIPFDESGDSGGCWTDYGDATWWQAVGSDGTEYLPMFTNKPWIAVTEKRQADGKTIRESTDEVGLLIAIGCPDTLTVGDQITVSILGFDVPTAYQRGDKYLVDIIGGRPLRLRGGDAGGSTRTFGVRGTVSGALDDYVLDNDSPAAYTDGTIAGLTFLITEGGIQFELGDRFRLDVNRNQYEVSTNGGGSWSTAADIPVSPATVTVLGGLTAEFVPGPGVSFEDGDLWVFDVVQPYAASHALTPDSESYQIDAALDLVIDFGTDQAVSLVALVTAIDVTATLLDASDVAVYPATLIAGRPVGDPQGNAGYLWIEAGTVNARKLRLQAADFTGEALTWVWAGAPFQIMRADQVQPRLSRVMSVGEGVNPAQLPVGIGYGLDMTWNAPPTAGYLNRADLLDLRRLMTAITLAGQPLIAIPNTYHGDAFLVRWASDTLADADKYRYQPEDTTRQRLSTSISLDPVYRA